MNRRGVRGFFDLFEFFLVAFEVIIDFLIKRDPLRKKEGPTTGEDEQSTPMINLLTFTRCMEGRKKRERIAGGDMTIRLMIVYEFHLDEIKNFYGLHFSPLIILSRIINFIYRIGRDT